METWIVLDTATRSANVRRGHIAQRPHAHRGHTLAKIQVFILLSVNPLILLVAHGAASNGAKHGSHY